MWFFSIGTFNLKHLAQSVKKYDNFFEKFYLFIKINSEKNCPSQMLYKKKSLDLHCKHSTLSQRFYEKCQMLDVPD